MSVFRGSKDVFPCRVGEETTIVGSSMREDKSKVKTGGGGERTRAPCEAYEACEAVESSGRSLSGMTGSKFAKRGQELVGVDGDIMKGSLARATDAILCTNGEMKTKINVEYEWMSSTNNPSTRRDRVDASSATFRRSASALKTSHPLGHTGRRRGRAESGNEVQRTQFVLSAAYPIYIGLNATSTRMLPSSYLHYIYFKSYCGTLATGKVFASRRGSFQW